MARNQKDDEYSLAEDSLIRCLMNIHEEESVNRANESSVRWACQGYEIH